MNIRITSAILCAAVLAFGGGTHGGADARASFSVHARRRDENEGGVRAASRRHDCKAARGHDVGLAVGRDERQPQKFYRALKALGKTVEFDVYPRGGHVLYEPMLQREQMRRNLDWFTRWIPR